MRADNNMMSASPEPLKQWDYLNLLHTAFIAAVEQSDNHITPQTINLLLQYLAEAQSCQLDVRPLITIRDKILQYEASKTQSVGQSLALRTQLMSTMVAFHENILKDAEIPIDISSLSQWNDSCGRIHRYLSLNIKENFLMEIATQLGALDSMHQHLQTVDKLFMDYYTLPDYLHEDCAFIAERILAVCEQLKKLYVVKFDENLTKAVDNMSKKTDALLKNHEKKQIKDVKYYNRALWKISSKLHTYDKETVKRIFNSIFCKNHPEILQEVMLHVIRFNDDGRINSIKILIDHGFDINQSVQERDEQHKHVSLLDYAIWCVSCSVSKSNELSVFKLLELGARVTDANIQDAMKYGTQELLEAVLAKRSDYKPSLEDCEKLVKRQQKYSYLRGRKADHTATIRLFYQRNILPSPSDILRCALTTGKFDIAKILMEEFSVKLPLLSQGQIAEIITHCSLSDLRYLKLKIPKSIFSYFTKGSKVAISAEKMAYCLENGAEITARLNLDSPNVLGCPQVVKALIELGKDPCQKISSCDDRYGEDISLLHYAAIHGHEDTIKLLIAAGADHTAKNSGGGIISGQTPLHYAAAHHNPGAVKALILAGADCDAVDDEGQTPLHKAVIEGWACSTDNIPCAKLLLLAGADPDIKDKQGKTPLESLYTDGWGARDRINAWTEAFRTASKRHEWDVRKNAQTLAQARRAGIGFFEDKKKGFADLPDELLIMIASLMGKKIYRIENDKASLQIAEESFHTPRARHK